jgi:hypothetical protein
VHVADTENRIYESDEDNNEAQVVVRLPSNPYRWRSSCRGRGNARALASDREVPAFVPRQRDEKAEQGRLRRAMGLMTWLTRASKGSLSFVDGGLSRDAGRG